MLTIVVITVIMLTITVLTIVVLTIILVAVVMVADVMLTGIMMAVIAFALTLLACFPVSTTRRFIDGSFRGTHSGGTWNSVPIPQCRRVIPIALCSDPG